jgi:nucleoside-diphosphate kinase
MKLSTMIVRITIVGTFLSAFGWMCYSVFPHVAAGAIHFNHRTCACIKPDAVAAGHTNAIMSLLEHNGFNIVRMSRLVLEREKAEQIYHEHRCKPFFGQLLEHITSGPIVVFELHKRNAVEDWRQLMGATNPAQAAQGTVRKMFGTDLTRNAVHGSDTSDAAERELSLFFD